MGEEAGILTGVSLIKEARAQESRQKRPKFAVCHSKTVRQLQRGTRTFLAAATWIEAGLTLEAYPALLSEEGETCIRSAVQDMQEPDRRSSANTRVEFLQRARQVGVETALAEGTGSLSSQGKNLFDLIASYCKRHPDLVRQAAPKPAIGSLEAMWSSVLGATDQAELRALAVATLERIAPDHWGEISPVVLQLADAANAAQTAFLLRRSDEDLEHFISAADALVFHPEFGMAGVDFKVLNFADAGQAYLDRYRRSRDPADLGAALCRWQHALDGTPERLPHRSLVEHERAKRRAFGGF